MRDEYDSTAPMNTPTLSLSTILRTEQLTKTVSLQPHLHWMRPSCNELPPHNCTCTCFESMLAAVCCVAAFCCCTSRCVSVVVLMTTIRHEALSFPYFCFRKAIARHEPFHPLLRTMGNIASEIICIPSWTAVTTCDCAVGCIQHVLLPLVEGLAVACACLFCGLSLALVAVAQYPVRIFQDWWCEIKSRKQHRTRTKARFSPSASSESDSRTSLNFHSPSHSPPLVPIPLYMHLLYSQKLHM
ncbi:hypothetical protein C8Q74DRAFT_1248779 [Fomes fomentarius]|nr:hypothetical protein C8Q74DRAFT_1248779 [Fomes fomentarius]